PDSHRLTDPDFALQNWASQILTPPNGTLCQNQPGDPTPAPCGFGAPEQDARHHIALFGDSHAGMWAAALIQFAEREGIRVHAYLASSCGATDDPLSFATYLTMDRREACNAWRAAATDQILSDPRIAVVVVSANAYSQKVWAGDRWAEDDGTGFAALWTRLRAAGKQVLVIDDVPMLPMKLPDCLARPHPADDPCTRPAQEVPQLTSLARGVALLPADEVHYVAMRDIFCDGDTCHAIIGGIPAYMDSDHISAPMARSLAPWIEPAVMQALSSQP
ncbi:MAG: hypothetical protein KDA50_09530, partial [Rhodobacteraceae bacterium]|nr:hypothetical protein [Paracoccaceae bacterium]